jgi:hypothetical protein
MHKNGYRYHRVKFFFQKFVTGRKRNRGEKNPGWIHALPGKGLPGKGHHGGASVQSGNGTSQRCHEKSISAGSASDLEYPGIPRKPLPQKSMKLRKICRVVSLRKGGGSLVVIFSSFRVQWKTSLLRVIYRETGEIRKLFFSSSAWLAEYFLENTTGTLSQEGSLCPLFSPANVYFISVPG